MSLNCVGRSEGGARTESNAIDGATAELRRCLLTQRTVRSLPVILEAPLFDDHPRLPQVVKDFSVQTFIPELVMKALNAGVLPG